MNLLDLYSKDACPVCGQTPCNCTHISEEKVRLDPKCWKGKKIGNPKTKVKGGVRVNNCVPAESVAETKADPTSTWVVYDGNKVKRFKTHQGAKAYAEQHGGKVASSAHYADKIQGKQGVEEAFIAPALSAANANAEYHRRGAAGGGYRGRIDIPVQSREDYISAGRALKKAAAAAGQKIEYGLSNGVMSVFSDSMDSGTLDQFIDSVLGQGVAENMADEFAKMAQQRFPNALVRKNGETVQQAPEYKPAGQDPAKLAQAWAQRYPNIDADIAAAKKDLDPNYEYAEGPAYYRGKAAQDRLTRLLAIKKIIDAGQPKEQSGLGFGENKEQEADYGDEYQSMVQRVGQKAREQEKTRPVDIQDLARRLRAIDQSKDDK